MSHLEVSLNLFEYNILYYKYIYTLNTNIKCVTVFSTHILNLGVPKYIWQPTLAFYTYYTLFNNYTYLFPI